MKFIIVATMFFVVFLQTTGDFAIHEGRKKAWHRWKGLSLAILGATPIILFLMQETGPNLGDYLASILGPYLMARWLYFDIFMNERLEMPIDYIGTTSSYGVILRKILGKTPPQLYLWIRFVAYMAYHISWIVEWWPGHYLLDL